MAEIIIIESPSQPSQFLPDEEIVIIELLIEDLYMKLSKRFHNSQADFPHGDYHIKNAVKDIVDISYKNYGDAGSEAELALFRYVWDTYVAFLKTINFTSTTTIKTVRKINEWAEDNISTSLTEFVNSLSWDHGYVPYQWAILSEEAGIDTSLWRVNPSFTQEIYISLTP